MNENAVKPGETANFSFKLQSPKSPQIYKEAFTLYLENVI